MLIENHRQPHHTFFESYICQDNILLIKWSSKTTLSHISWVINCFNHTKHFLSHNALINKFYCRSISINSFITRFESFSVQEKISTHDGNYQLPHYTFLDFSSSLIVRSTWQLLEKQYSLENNRMVFRDRIVWTILMINFSVSYRVYRACPTNIPRGFYVETTWKQLFPRQFNAESTWCVCRVWIGKVSFHVNESFTVKK